MAILKSSKAGSTRIRRAKVEIAEAVLGFARINDTATGEPKAYQIFIDQPNSFDGDVTGREYSLTLSVEEWERMVNLWAKKPA